MAAGDITDRIGGARAALAYKAPVRAATTANITLSGEQTIDDVAVVEDDRVLVKDQTTGSENGIYVAKEAAWERAKDWNGSGDIVKGTQVAVSSGTVNALRVYGVSTADPITIDTTSVALTLVTEFGSVVGPSSSTDNSVARFDGTTGALIQDSGIIVDDSDNITGIATADITHTSTETDDHALELFVDAAGFGDVKGLEIQYDTGVLSTGEDEAIILININEVDAVGGDVIALDVLATDGAADDVFAIQAGPTVNAIRQMAGVFANPVLWSNNGVDETSEVTGAGTSSVFVADNDFVTITSAAKFADIEIELTTASSNPGIKPTFEFSTGGSGFTAFTPIDGTDGFRQTGVIGWDTSDIPSWATNASGNFEIRMTRTQNSLSTTPIVDTAQIAAVTNFVWDKSGDVNLNSLTLVTDLAVAEGGTGASTAAAAYSNLAGTTFETKEVSVLVFDDSENVVTGNGAGDLFFRVPSTMNGMNLVAVAAQVQTAGTTGTTDIQINNVTQAADMLSTVLTIDSGETDSSTAAAAAVIDTANDDVATGDQIRIDVDAVSTTAPKGLLVELQFRLP